MQENRKDPFLILLDNIEDPHNLGAIIRTANLAGAHGVIIPKRRAVGLTATVAKTSAGALNYTPVAKVTNLAKTMEELKEKGLWFVCADMGGESMYRLNLKGPIGLVIGNEGEGVGRLVKEKCDFVASIPMKGEIDSLNASVAASQRKKHLPLNSYVSLYEESVEEGKKVPLIDTIEPQEENNPEALYFGKEFTEIFSERLKENLSTLENHVLELHLMGTDYRKIAELLGKSPKAVDKALQRIKSKAQKLLKNELR